jgi:hypothetical protein
MDFRKNYLIPFFALLGLVSVLVLLTIAYFLFKQTKLSSVSRSLTWEDCVKDSRSVIMEIYPARCSIAGVGTVTQPISDEDKKKLIPPVDAGCQNDSDCTLVVKDSWGDCSLITACQPIDYSEEKWVAVNQEKYAASIRGCEIPAMMCDPKPLNDKFSAKCVSGSCRKEPSP